ncbi:MAG: Uma2 family endonuclease [Chloroflexaceae bacterium]|jgi:Uma2 family endonuclease|nr:Uma2 family endonuclease [Chloroflexaceae bacterium]
MSTIETPTTVSAAAPADAFPYGWRYVRHDKPDGTWVMEQVPLTLEDVLHPQEDDQATHSSAHQRRCAYFFNVLRAQVQHDRTAVVLHDVRIAWDVPELGAHGPDIMLIFGVREVKNWSTFDVAAEGTRPSMIIEVVSPETRAVDVYHKLDEYDMAGVPLYVIVDTVQRRGQRMMRLLGYQQTKAAYVPLQPDSRGWLWLEPVRLYLGVEENEVYCYDEHGVRLGDYADLARALEAAQQAQSEAAARIKALEEELARLRGNV